MIKPIIRDILFLSKKSSVATKDDIPTANDLLDTLKANTKRCVGMAANMIGISKRIIVFSAGPFFFTMFNPEIISSSNEYETEEGCLSLDGVRKTKRYEKITVKFQDKDFKTKTQSFSGFTAQIIQHEIDHLNGIII